MKDSKILKLFEDFPDEVRHPLIVENVDWEDSINPAMYELILATRTGILDSDSFINILRCVIESIYIMGYQRGQNEKSL